MTKCVFKSIDDKGNIVTYNCSDIPYLKKQFRYKNHTDKIIKTIGKDAAYERYCMDLDRNCKCDDIDFKCEKCPAKDHEGRDNYFCRCEDRNIKLAKQLRSKKHDATLRQLNLD